MPARLRRERERSPLSTSAVVMSPLSHMNYFLLTLFIPSLLVNAQRHLNTSEANSSVTSFAAGPLIRLPSL